MKVISDIECKNLTVETINGTPPQQIIDNLKNDLVDGTLIVNNATSATNATNYNINEGTIKDKFDSIEQRLDSLGFKEGSVDIKNATLTKKGDYAILVLPEGVHFSNGITEYIMSFISAESFEQWIATPQNFTKATSIRFSQNSNIITINSYQGARIEGSLQIGFRILQ